MSEKQTMRDVLMAFAEEVRSDLSAVVCDSSEPWVASSQFDLDAIVDRYASQFPTEQKDSVAINQQMLAALSAMVTAFEHQDGSELYRAAAILKARVAIAEAAQPVGDKTWFDGYPPFPQDQEWFIAITTYGDRVVLRALDKDYSSYQYTTADHTYIKKESIAHWMQFPDCEYLPPKTPQPASAKPVAQCPNCLGTKQPHALDPEWKGKCECAAHPPSVAVPVAWRYIRSADGEVLHDTVELIPWPPAHLRYMQKHFDVEIVPLYAHPPAVSVPDNLLARLEHHMQDKENTAFARSTMRELHALLSAAQKAGSELPRHLIIDTETIMKEKK